MPYLESLTRRTIALALQHRDPSGLILWVRTLAVGLGDVEQSSDLAAASLRQEIRGLAHGPCRGLTAQQLLESLALAALANLAITLMHRYEHLPSHQQVSIPVVITQA
jgi:hypothetical protein